MESKTILIRLTSEVAARQYDIVVNGETIRSGVSKEYVRTWMKDNYHPAHGDTFEVEDKLIKTDFYQERNVRRQVAA